MNNYAKGEWKACRNALGTWAISTDNEPIAQVDSHRNAHLIAAAPAMYEALKAFDHYLCAAPPHNMKLKKYAVDLMEKALSKAEGKQ